MRSKQALGGPAEPRLGWYSATACSGDAAEKAFNEAVAAIRERKEGKTPEPKPAVEPVAEIIEYDAEPEPDDAEIGAEIGEGTKRRRTSAEIAEEKVMLNIAGIEGSLMGLDNGGLIHHATARQRAELRALAKRLLKLASTLPQDGRSEDGRGGRSAR
jgi:hypothetical protein